MISEGQDSNFEYDQSYRYISHANQPGGDKDKELISKSANDRHNLDMSDFVNHHDKLGETRNQLLNHFDSPTSSGSEHNSFKKDEDLKQQEFESKINLNHVILEDEEDKQQPDSKGDEPQYDLDRMPQNVMKLMQSKTMFGSSKNAGIMQLGQEEENLELKLDFDEEPVTQGSVDPLIKITEKKQERFIVKHNSNFRIRWDLIIITLVIYNCIQIPIDLAFQEKFHNDGLEVVGYLVDLCFVMDIILNFRTTYINQKTGLEVMNGKEIAISYLKQWRFWCDIFSIIPFELMYNLIAAEKNGNTTTFKVFDLMKLIRLLRLGRIITYLKFKQDIKIGFRIFILLAFLLGLVHWVACIWYLIIDGSTWMPPKDANYGQTQFYEMGMGDQYAIVFYYAILLIVGSEIDPMETNQTIVASLVVIMGSITTAFIFGNMAALMAAINQKDNQFQEQYDTISNLMRSIQLPILVQEEVESYLLHIQQVPDMQADMHVFLKMLSPSLRSQILFHIYKTIIRQISIFDQCSNIELRYMVNKMRTVIFLPDDEIIRQGDKGTKIYFISRGKVEVWIGPDEAQDSLYEFFKRGKTITSNNLEKSKSSIDINDQQSESSKTIASFRLLKELDEGDYFGEVALLTNLKRTATCKAKDFTTLAYMMKRHFRASKEEFPQIYQNFKKQIALRYNDENFKFRKKMIANVPYFKNMSEHVIQELVYLLKPTRYDINQLVVKRGDSTDKIYFLKAGLIDVEVPLKFDKMRFDSLNTGSCFCIFSAFNEDKKQKFDFRTKSVCIVETISASDIAQLQKEQLELSDELKTLRVQIENNEKSEFDFFRYVPSRKDITKQGEERRAVVRRKFRIAIATFFKKVKKSRHVLDFLSINKKIAGNEDAKYAVYDQVLDENNSDSDEDNDQRKHFKALYYLDQLEKERKDKDMKLKYLKDKCSNPTFFALQAMLGKKSLVDEEAHIEHPSYEQDVNQDKDDNFDDEDCETIRKEFVGDQNHSVSYFNNNLSRRSVEQDPNFPKINGIRNEILKIRSDTYILNTQEINEISHINNVSQPGPQYRNNNLHHLNNVAIEKVISPNGGQAYLQLNQGDMTSFKLNTTCNQEELIKAAVNTQRSIEQLKPVEASEIILIERSSPQAADLNNLKQRFSKNQPKHSSSLVTQKMKTLYLDNNDQTINQASSSAKNSIVRSASKVSKIQLDDDQLDLIAVLKNINSSLENQAKTMATLQSDMQKRMKNLEKKLERAIKVDKDGEDNSQMIVSRQGSSIPSNIDMKISPILPREEQKLQSKIQGIESMSATDEKLNSQPANNSAELNSKKKRLVSRPQMLKDYNSSSANVNFISQKQSPQNAFLPISASINMPQTPITVSKINAHEQSSRQESQRVGNKGNNSQTPYFFSENVDTIVDKEYPIKKDLEALSSSNMTNELDQIAGGPSFKMMFAKKNPAAISQQKNLHHPQTSIIINPALSQDDIANQISYTLKLQQEIQSSINKGEIEGEGQHPYHDNTMVFEEHLDKSQERLQQVKEVRDQVIKNQTQIIEEAKEIANSSRRESSQNALNPNNNGQQVNINIIWLPNSIVQFKGTNDIVEAARSQQQQNPTHQKMNSQNSNKVFKETPKNNNANVNTANNRQQEL